MRPSFSRVPLAAVSRKVRMLLFTFSLSPPACGIVSVPGDGFKFRETGIAAVRVDEFNLSRVQPLLL